MGAYTIACLLVVIVVDETKRARENKALCELPDSLRELSTAHLVTNVNTNACILALQVLSFAQLLAICVNAYIS